MAWHSRIMLLIMLIITHTNIYSSLSNRLDGSREIRGKRRVVVGGTFPVCDCEEIEKVVTGNRTQKSIETIDCCRCDGSRNARRPEIRSNQPFYVLFFEIFICLSISWCIQNRQLVVQNITQVLFAD